MEFNKTSIQEIKSQMINRGCCHLTLKNGLQVTVQQFRFESNPLLLAKGKDVEELKQLFNSKGDHGFCVATFLLKDSPVYLMFQKDHLPDLCDALLTDGSLYNCWCYKLVYNQQLFTSGTQEWKAIWSAIIKNGSPYLEAVILSPKKVLHHKCKKRRKNEVL